MVVVKAETVNEFRGKTAFVTGASRGIGAAAALALARAGASRVVVHYNWHREGAEATLEAVRAAGAEAASIQADLAEEAGIEACLAALAEIAPQVDLLINNAGSLVQRVPFAEYPSDLFDRVMRLNLKSAWRISQALASGMVARGSGVIVFVSSIAARNGGDGAGIHATGQAARIEDNHCVANDRGIDVDADRNLIIRNTCGFNTVDYDIVANNKVGVIVAAPNSSAISGSTGGSALGTTDPWANFSF